jgi:predicted ferric reductase
VHLYSYLALGLSLFHQLATGAAFGPEAWRGTVAGAVLGERARTTIAGGTRALWVAAFVFTLCTVLWYRLVLPAARSRRYDLRVDGVEPLEGGAVRVALAGRRLQALQVVGGQFAQFRFGRRGLLWQAHPYSFSGLPDRSRLYLTIGGGGDYAQAVASLSPGTKVYFEGPYGTLTASAASSHADGARAVAILVSGLGVTPICSLLRDLPPESRPVVIYRVRRAEEALYVAELRRLTAERGGDLRVLVGSRDVHPLYAGNVEAWAPDIATRHVYVCGSRGFVERARRSVLELGVPRERLTTEAFAW